MVTEVDSSPLPSAPPSTDGASSPEASAAFPSLKRSHERRASSLGVFRVSSKRYFGRNHVSAGSVPLAAVKPPLPPADKVAAAAPLPTGAGATLPDERSDGDASSEAGRERRGGAASRARSFIGGSISRTATRVLWPSRTSIAPAAAPAVAS